MLSSGEPSTAGHFDQQLWKKYIAFNLEEELINDVMGRGIYFGKKYHPCE